MSLESEREEFLTMFLAVREDAVHWLPETQGKDTPFIRRAFVRATIAFVEGVAHAMKRLALAMHEAGEAQFSAAELAVLRGETYELSSQGVAKARLLKVRTLENLRFAFRSFALAHHLDVTLSVEGAGWQSMQRAMQIRHRLLHPKSSVDLNVSDEEVEVVNSAGKWMQDATIELLMELKGHIRSRVLNLAHQSVFDERLFPP